MIINFQVHVQPHRHRTRGMRNAVSGVQPPAFSQKALAALSLLISKAQCKSGATTRVIPRPQDYLVTSVVDRGLVGKRRGREGGGWLRWKELCARFLSCPFWCSRLHSCPRGRLSPVFFRQSLAALHGFIMCVARAREGNIQIHYAHSGGFLNRRLLWW